MADLTSAIQSGLALGRAFGGNSDTYNQAYARTAQRDALLAEAQARRQKQMALESLPKTLTEAGYDQPTASVLQQAILAGVDPTKLSGYKGDIQEQGFRGNSVASALAGDWGGANANLMGIANGPVELAAIQGQNLINNRLLPGGGGVSTTDQGRAGMAADQARAAASYASANSSNASAKAALGRLAIAQQQAALEQSGNWAPGRNFAAAGGSGRVSEDERKAAGWYGQASRAIQNMDNATFKHDSSGAVVMGRDGKPVLSGAQIPGLIETYSPIDELANRSRSPERQMYVNAASSLSEALLRAATGAGVNESEARQKVAEVTPLRGDSDQVILQKAEMAKAYLGDLKTRAGRALPQSSLSNAFGGVATQAPAAPVRRAVNPTTGKTIILVNGQWVPE